MGKFNLFNQILLSLCDVLNVFLSKHWSENELYDVNDLNTIMKYHEMLLNRQINSKEFG